MTTTILRWERSPGYGNARPHWYLICASCTRTYSWDNHDDPKFCPHCGSEVEKVLTAPSGGQGEKHK